MNRSAFDVFFCFLSIFLTFDSKLYFLILYTNSSACLLHLNITQIFAIRVRTHNSWCPNAERVSSSWSWWKETPYCARSRISNLTVLPWALSNMFEEIGLQVALVLKRITWYQHPKKSSAQKKAKAYSIISIYYDFWCEYVPIFYQQKNAPRHPTCLFRREGACQTPLALVTSTQKQPPPAGHSRIFHRKVQQQHSKCVFHGFQHLAKFGGGSPWFYWDKKKNSGQISFPRTLTFFTSFMYWMVVRNCDVKTSMGQGCSKRSLHLPAMSNANSTCIRPITKETYRGPSMKQPKKYVFWEEAWRPTIFEDCFPRVLHATCSQWMRE